MPLEIVWHAKSGTHAACCWHLKTTLTF